MTMIGGDEADDKCYESHFLIDLPGARLPVFFDVSGDRIAPGIFQDYFRFRLVLELLIEHQRLATNGVAFTQLNRDS